MNGMSTHPHPLSANLGCLRQGADLVRRLDAAQFRAATDLVPGGTVGSHFRHCLDFYASFLRGLEVGKIDYDARDRSPELETLPERAVTAMQQAATKLDALGEELLDQVVRVRGDGPGGEGEGWSRSTVGRELQYLLSHTIHHFAIIGFILRARGFEPASDFGVAPSTLRHWEEAGGPVP
jgi:uncharacterized damage-inducible protein DinB